MKILHTADWHLGKTLEGASRQEEQEFFVKELVQIVDEDNIDMVIIAGDVFDSINPPAAAEKLFYKALKLLSSEGKRIVTVIAGNHDNPERLVASKPLAYEQGIILLGKPKSAVEVGQCGQHKIIDAGQGYFEIDINGEKAVVITVPYPSEKRLNEVIFDDIDDKERQKSYSGRVGELFSKLEAKFREDTLNIAVSHLFTIGGKESSSERNIQLGGSLAVYMEDLPLNADYIALGHLHRPQEIKNKGCKIIYAGSPLQYSKSEIGYSKCCYIFEKDKENEIQVYKKYFSNYKPIEVWKCNSIDEAIEKCEENKDKNSFVYLSIKTDRFISNEEIKVMKSFKKDILEIKPIIDGNEKEEDEYEDYKEKSMKELFTGFYSDQKNLEPTAELMELFLSIVDKEEDI